MSTSNPPSSPIVGIDACEVFYEAMTGDPRLDHPECVAIGPDGSVWCGGELGQIYCITPDGSTLDQVASTGGFCLGIALDSAGNVFVCDIKHAAVMRMDAKTGRVERFADGASGTRMKVPNYIVIDGDDGLYVSDSHASKVPGPGVFRFTKDGQGELWYGASINFANGMALSEDGRHLYVAETFGNLIFRVPIASDGSAGAREEVAHMPGFLPDGLAFDVAGNLYVGCYEPSVILLVKPGAVVETFVSDPEAHVLCHPTNVAFRGTTLFAANLGRWHITAVPCPTEGLTLAPMRGSRADSQTGAAPAAWR